MSHLGGHCNKTWIDVGLLRYLKAKYKVSSMLDIGCGPQGMREPCKTMEIDWFGIDGDKEVATDSDDFILWDFNDGIPPINRDFDLGWSVEFLEHVDEDYQHNYMRLFQWCKRVIVTAAPPGWPGHHHVNLQTKDYWINVFKTYGFEYKEKVLPELQLASTMKEKKGESFFKRNGMFFERIIK